MGRLVAGVIALAVFVVGAMYWSQAEQLQTMPAQPLCPGVTCADKAITPVENASAVAQDPKDEGCPCCKDKDTCKQNSLSGCEQGCSKGEHDVVDA
jgi:hypothetical protein